MSSLELVQFINNQRDVGAAELAHSDFLKKVPQVLGEVAGNFSSNYIASNGKQNPCYSFLKREACLMAMSYSYDLQAKVFDRMTALEAKQATPAALSVMDILHIAMESEKGRLLALEQRDHAIATKAQIGSKREATAMATASAAKKESAALKAQLGFNEQHATVKAVQAATGKPYAWLPLRRWCEALNQPPKNVTDPLYGAVKAWPSGAWASVYSVDLVDLFGEVTA